mgnify:CR=1 FL=1
MVITAGATGDWRGKCEFHDRAEYRQRAYASLVIADQMVKVTQEATSLPVDCSYTREREECLGSRIGDERKLCVGDCACRVVSGSPPATHLGFRLRAQLAGSGNGTVTFSISSNTGAPRTGTLTIAGPDGDGHADGSDLVLLFGQSIRACPFLRLVRRGTSVSVTASTGCPWTAATTVAWISIASGSSGTANGTVTFTVAANAGAARTGTLTVANQTVTVNQAAAPCSYSVTPTNVSIEPAGGTGIRFRCPRRLVVHGRPPAT